MNDKKTSVVPVSVPHTDFYIFLIVYLISGVFLAAHEFALGQYWGMALSILLLVPGFMFLHLSVLLRGVCIVMHTEIRRLRQLGINPWQ